MKESRWRLAGEAGCAVEIRPPNLQHGPVGKGYLGPSDDRRGAGDQGTGCDLQFPPYKREVPLPQYTMSPTPVWPCRRHGHAR